PFMLEVENSTPITVYYRRKEILRDRARVMESFCEQFKTSTIGILIASSNDEPEHLSPPKKARQGNPRQEKKLGNRVLIIGRQRELALYRAEFLRLAGYTVSTPEDVDEAVRIMQGGEFDAIVLSYTLSNDAVERLAEVAREYCP